MASSTRSSTSRLPSTASSPNTTRRPNPSPGAPTPTTSSPHENEGSKCWSQSTRSGVGIEQHRGSLNAWIDLPQQLQPLACERWLVARKSGDVTAGTGEAIHHAIADWVSDAEEEQGDGSSLSEDRNGAVVPFVTMRFGLAPTTSFAIVGSSALMAATRTSA